MNGYYDASLADYPRYEGESSDDGRIQRAISDCERGVLYFPAGVYSVTKPVNITNCCSLLMHKSAVIKAVCEMSYVIIYDAAQSYPDIRVENWCIVPSDDPDSEDWNLFVTGGVIDGAGIASCMRLDSFKHLTLRDISFRNGKEYGLFIEGEGSTWTFELIAQNLYCKCTMPGLAPNCGIHSNGGDSHFTDCIIVDYTIGFEMSGGGSNRLTRCHVWGGPLPPESEGAEPEMLEDSVNYLLDSYDIILTDCYADTGKTGFLVMKDARLRGCSYFNNFAYGMDDVTVIDHRGGRLLVSEGLFRKTSPKATLYKGDKKNLMWINNTLDGDFEEHDL